jgi:hypothetical protein
MGVIPQINITVTLANQADGTSKATWPSPKTQKTVTKIGRDKELAKVIARDAINKEVAPLGRSVNNCTITFQGDI